ncbi:MAG: hypothetical protein KC496_02905 [Anaerolineae bacterium]|nr:hypothetical protein [Anaerolineae bacterium]
MDDYYSPDIPYDILDDFLFNEFIEGLHPSLQNILRDVQYMQHEAESEEITSIQSWWNVDIPYYTCSPWFFSDVLPVSEEQLITLGKAHLLAYADSILTDNLVDGQMPEVPGPFLTTSQLRLEGMRQWLSLFGQDHPFWKIYQDTERRCYWGLAHEREIVEYKRMPYTVDDYFKVTAGKFAIYERMIRAMGFLSNEEQKVQPVLEAFRYLFVADCLFDDAADWEADALDGRRTLPIVLALQETNTPLEHFGELSVAEIEALIHRSSMMPRQTARALEYLENARGLVQSANLGDSFLSHLIERNHQNAVKSHKIYRVAQGVDSFISAMSR